ncbi:hypothetical protein KY290_011928 [Solanum tuberosum]|uniref:Uncharacterized protein n=1 Tax=Solanum tuberosum TaxID=4113 RepID=A0ABQ7W242_SOLTU|nr:hypothetical protein KY289_012451 [Solanum tuberosum]KAH0710587.1 hypothetical protein KY284_012014 [Solanum tuberosum]KAH0736259.1 hypothetical protein KY285_011966 [Solanum tuberosum]KAH0774791.1 hypothetical protein KY290_011928 [Solanum tuberosum]
MSENNCSTEDVFLENSMSEDNRSTEEDNRSIEDAFLENSMSEDNCSIEDDFLQKHFSWKDNISKKTFQRGEE